MKSESEKQIKEDSDVLKYLQKARDNRFSTMMVQVTEGRVVFIEVSEKVRM